MGVIAAFCFLEHMQLVYLAFRMLCVEKHLIPCVYMVELTLLWCQQMLLKHLAVPVKRVWANEIGG